MNFPSALSALSALALAASAALPARAVTLVQWNFNSVVADAATATGTTAPAIGAGVASLVGGTTATFASGDASGGSSDPTVGDDSGWNLTAFPAQGTNDKTAGAQFTTSTAGFQNVVVSWDQRYSNTASKYTQLQYTVNGTTYADAPTGLFLTAAGDTWVNGNSFDFSSVAGVNNNASFGVRIVSTFRPNTTAYDPANPAGTYGTTGTYRFDMVTISASAVPEPATLALWLAGLGAVGLVARRRS